MLRAGIFLQEKNPSFSDCSSNGKHGQQRDHHHVLYDDDNDAEYNGSHREEGLTCGGILGVSDLQ